MRHSDAESSDGVDAGRWLSARSSPPAAGRPRQYPCLSPGCDRLFSSKFKLVRHSLIHGGERPFECPSCERRFHRKDHLKTHLQIHDPNKALHSCALCGKKYSSVLSFRKHSALHAAEAGDPVCRLCGAAFARREDVMLHLKVHSGSRVVKTPTERRFKCDRCDRSFFTRKDVKRHMVVHTGQRNFVCQFCPQKFGRKDHLVRHTKKTHSAGGSSSVAEVPKREENGLAVVQQGPSGEDAARPCFNEPWPTALLASSPLLDSEARAKVQAAADAPFLAIVPHFLPTGYYVSAPPPVAPAPATVELAPPLPHFSQAFQ